jgi:hypothetical protein
MGSDSESDGSDEDEARRFHQTATLAARRRQTRMDNFARQAEPQQTRTRTRVRTRQRGAHVVSSVAAREEREPPVSPPREQRTRAGSVTESTKDFFFAPRKAEAPA